VISIVFLLLFVVACKMAAMLPQRPIAIPGGLDSEHIEVAVLAAITERPVAGLMQMVNRPDGGGREAVRMAALTERDPSARGWFPELIQPGEIWTSYYRGRHRLDVAIRYTRFELTMEITGSEFLSQDGGTIHNAAIAWVRELESRIERSFKTVAMLVPQQSRE
jgi:hypothetical protein